MHKEQVKSFEEEAVFPGPGLGSLSSVSFTVLLMLVAKASMPLK